MSILEEQPVGSVVGLLHAIDEDINENGAIDYVITDGNQENLFRIERLKNNSAVIKSAVKFDRETVSSFLLTVKCFKYGTSHAAIAHRPYNKKDFSTIEVNVKIIDIDDHLPEFQEKNPSFGVRFNVPIDYSLITLKATDIDPNAQPLSYYIDFVMFIPQFFKDDNNSIENIKDLFSINSVTGEIRTAKTLSDYVDGYFDILVRVNNANDTSRMQHNKVKIYVIRDKSLLKFVFAKPPAEVREYLDEFTAAVQAKLKDSDLELNVLDTKVLIKTDQIPDFSYTG